MDDKSFSLGIRMLPARRHALGIPPFFHATSISFHRYLRVPGAFLYSLYGMPLSPGADLSCFTVFSTSLHVGGSRVHLMFRCMNWWHVVRDSDWLMLPIIRVRLSQVLFQIFYGHLEAPTLLLFNKDFDKTVGIAKEEGCCMFLPCVVIWCSTLCNFVRRCFI